MPEAPPPLPGNRTGYSSDGKYWWDGREWTPIYTPPSDAEWAERDRRLAEADSRAREETLAAAETEKAEAARVLAAQRQASVANADAERQRRAERRQENLASKRAAKLAAAKALAAARLRWNPLHRLARSVPGFRSLKWWKILVALPYYLFWILCIAVGVGTKELGLALFGAGPMLFPYVLFTAISQRNRPVAAAGAWAGVALSLAAVVTGLVISPAASSPGNSTSVTSSRSSGNGSANQAASSAGSVTPAAPTPSPTSVEPSSPPPTSIAPSSTANPVVSTPAQVSPSPIESAAPTLPPQPPAPAMALNVPTDGLWHAEMRNIDLSQVASVTYYLRDARGRWITRVTSTSTPFAAEIDWRRGQSNGEMVVTAHVLLSDGSELKDPGGWIRVAGSSLNPGGSLTVVGDPASSLRAAYSPEREAGQLGSVDFWIRDAQRRWMDVGPGARGTDGVWTLPMAGATAEAWGRGSVLSVHAIYPTGRQVVDPAPWLFSTETQSPGKATGSAGGGDAGPGGVFEAYRRLDSGIGARYRPISSTGVTGVEFWLREPSGRWLDAGSANQTGGTWSRDKLDGSDTPGFSIDDSVASVHVIRADGRQAIDPAPWAMQLQKELIADVSATATPSAHPGDTVHLTLTVKNIGRTIGQLGIRFPNGDNWLDHVNGGTSSDGCSRDDGLSAVLCGRLGAGQTVTYDISASARDTLRMQLYPVVLDYYFRGSAQSIKSSGGAVQEIALVEAVVGVPAAAPSAAPRPPQAPPKPQPVPVPVAPPAPAPVAGSCSAAMANPKPGDGGTDTINISSNVRNSGVTISAHYKTTDHVLNTTTSANGAANLTFSIGRPTIGYTVVVDVDISGQAQCSTSFTPQ